MESFEKQAGEKIRLRELVFQLLESYQPVAVQQRSYFLNEIPADCTLHTDRTLLATLLGSIFYVMARCGQETCIRVSAQAFQNDIFLEVKDTGTSNSYPVLVGLQHLRLLAARMGGHVDLSGHRENAATILFSFPNLRGAA